MKIIYVVTCLSVGVMLGTSNSNNAFAQQNYVGNSSAKSSQTGYNTNLTKVDKYGYIFNSSDICIGTIDKNGNILNGNNANLGRIYKNGFVYNAKNDAVGKVDKKGNIYTQYNVLLGKVDKKGQVYNSNNVVVGQVAKDHKTAALLLLLKENNLFNQY
ncbi:5-fold beta-flower protein [Commensalibacter papalotli (ex Servin-Garciduenas et al. 2014)]|uniref:Uncharacterized protein n=1 Tax=Commensalibacter papalotli (ex Servin-Garciduenas et al. 2014) TaxID=1208583 RepID=W7DWD3_9PROT|nr:hypothetical protein [Commensalibacter papalotli (ex Servin-Garciduenas et al. 2014)]EUK19390.1 hypothetical protein COMX_06550 [Commensalibacter papalotli (ex Servin-Garciduenas et al. 2014)]